MGKKDTSCKICQSAEADKRKFEGKLAYICKNCFQNDLQITKQREIKCVRKCLNCKKIIKNMDSTKCLNCLKYMHKGCVNLKNELSFNFGTFCFKCSKKININQNNELLFPKIENMDESKIEKSDNYAISYPNLSQVNIFNSTFSMAMKLKGLLYTNDNIYLVNKDKIHKKDTISDKDSNLIEKFKDLNSKGIYPPLKIDYNTNEEFTVVATDKIEKNSLITEYCGEVNFFNKIRYSESDSLFTLWESNKEYEELTIDPSKKCNLGRFINSKKDGNCTSKTCIIKGEPRIFIYANKDIEKGENLYYNYNGSRNDYYLQNN